MELSRLMMSCSDARKAGQQRVGAKAFKVAVCHQAAVNVPKTVILPVDVFRLHLRGEKLDSLFESVQNSFPGVNTLIVRSSALKEDDSCASFAGQFSSAICRNDAREIGLACRTCWASCFSSNVECYDRAMGATDPSRQAQEMAVLIQELVSATAAGICFTADPATARKRVFTINAVHGLGSAVAEDEVVSDYYEFHVGSRTSNVLIGGLQRDWRSPGNPTVLEHLPPHLTGKLVLTPGQIERVGKMAHRVSRLFGARMDIEWAFADDRLFLLQARPITSVASVRAFQLWTRDNVADVIPDAVTPLTWSLLSHATNHGFNRFASQMGLAGQPVTLFDLFEGRAYFNQTLYNRIFGIVGQSKRNPLFLCRVGFNYLRMVLSLGKRVARLERGFIEVLDASSHADTTAAISLLKRSLDAYMELHIEIAGLMELTLLVIRRMVGEGGEKNANSLVDGLVTGMGTIESVGFGAALWDLCGQIEKNGPLANDIMNAPDSALPNLLSQSDEACGKAWRQFLDTYGYSSLKEFEIYYPRWNEDPSFVATTLRQYLRQGDHAGNNRRGGQLAGRRRDAERSCLENMHPLLRPLFRLYVGEIRKYSAWRESVKQKLVRIMAGLRGAVLRLVSDASISPADNVFFLSLEEILASREGSFSSETLRTAAERRRLWEAQSMKEPLKEIKVYADGTLLTVPYLSGQEQQLKGLSLSSGKHTGRARVIVDPRVIGSFDRGDVLVVRSTNPSWTPLFTLAGAIVSDMGNYLSHGAIVARELGIPAVGNIFDATKRIKDGETISVDGDHGTVQIMKKG